MYRCRFVFFGFCPYPWVKSSRDCPKYNDQATTGRYQDDNTIRTLSQGQTPHETRRNKDKDKDKDKDKGKVKDNCKETEGQRTRKGYLTTKEAKGEGQDKDKHQKYNDQSNHNYDDQNPKL